MKIQFLDEAYWEFVEAVRHYNRERPGLGFEFSNEVKSALNRIKNFPEAWPFISENIRKCVLNRFPYSVLYYRDSDILMITALMHHKRKPGYWQELSSGTVNDG